MQDEQRRELKRKERGRRRSNPINSGESYFIRKKKNRKTNVEIGCCY